MGKNIHKADSERAKAALLNLLEDQQDTIAKLKESEKFNKLLIEKSPIGLAICSMDGKYTDANPAFAFSLGRSVNEILNLSIADVTPEKYNESDLRQLQNLNEFGSFGPYEKELIHKDGHLIPVIITGVLIKKNDEDFIWSTIEDITKKKKAEELLRESERQFRSLYENSGIGFYRTTPEGKILLANPAFINMLGFESFETFSQRNLELDGYEPSYSRKDFKANIEKNGEIKGLEEIWKRKDGSLIYVRENAKVVYSEKGEVLYYEGTVEDVTESKKAEQKIRDSEEIFRTIFATLSDAVFITDMADGTIVSSNDKLFGYSPDEIIGNSTFALGMWKSPEERQFIIDSINKNGSVVDLEAKLIRKNGSIFTGSISANPITIQNEKYMLTVIRDVTDRNRAAELLKQSEEQFKVAFYTSPDSVNINRLEDGMYVLINEGFTRMTGFTEEDVIGKTSIEINIWANTEDRKKLVAGLREKGKYENLEAPFRIKDGSIVYGLMSATIIKLDGVDHLLNITRDITERKKAELIQWELREELHTTLYSIGDAVISADKDGMIKQMNPVAEQLTGWRLEDTKGKNLSEIFNIVCESTHQRIENPVNRVLREGAIIGLANHTVLISKDGTERPIANSGAPMRDKDGNITGVVLVFRDQTEERAAQELLRRNEERMRAIVEGTPNLFFYLQDAEGNTTYVSPTIKDITGYMPEIWMKQKNWFITNSDINKNVISITHKHLQGKNTEGAILIEVEHALGYPIMLEVFENTIIQDGKVIGLQGVAHDISARKMAEDALQKTNETLQSIILSSPLPIIAVDMDGIVKLWNPASEKTFGWSESEALGCFIPTVSEDKIMEYKEISEKIVKKEVSNFEVKRRKKDGSPIDVNISAVLLHDREGKPNGILSIQMDITDRKQMLEELVLAKNKAEEANATKDLFLANMSHELRTPLIGILGYSDLLTDILNEEENVEMAKGIKRSGKRLLNTLNMILNFTKIESEKNEIVLRGINIAEEIEAIYKMFKGAAIEKKLSFTLELLNPDLTINIDPSFFAVIMENLVNNAIKFTTNGFIKIIAGRKNDEYVFIKVQDSGIGIDEKYYNVIFEEFRQISEGINREFQGTGLGLSIAKKYTEMMNGSINIESRSGIGTTFTLTFPAYKRNDDISSTPDSLIHAG